MKVGDLVSLSSYGKRLSFISRYVRDYGKTHSGVDGVQPIIGLLIKMEDKRYSWAKTKYTVSWIGQGPPGREHYASYFYRSDLKMVSKS